MKKVSIIVVVMMVFIKTMNGQFLGGFFDQQATELKYYEQQIAYLELYIGYLEKGYKIAQAGLTTIGEIKKGEFDLHNAFFSSLKAANPAVSNYSKVAEIISYQLAIVSDFKKALKRLQESNRFSSFELSYLYNVYSNMSSECTKSLTALIDIITGGSFEMKDDERIKRIDSIYADMKDKYAFTQSFTNQASLIAGERTDELNEIEFLQNLN